MSVATIEAAPATVEDTPSPIATDPLASVATAMRDAANAVGDGASNMLDKTKQAVPATKRFISRVAYSGSFYLSFGIVFPSLFVTNFVPGLGTIANGLTDGARAAKGAAIGANGKSPAQ